MAEVTSHGFGANMLVTVINAEAGDKTVTVQGYGHDPILVQAFGTGNHTGGTLAVSGSLDGTNFDPITALAFSAADINNKLIKATTTYKYAYLKFVLDSVTYATTGTTSVILSR